MDLNRIEKPLRKMRQLLKTLPENPAPEEVHKLRTRTRRIEAVTGALQPIDNKETKRLLRTIKPVRRAAGRVRDMDVLTANLLHFEKNGNGNSLLRLVEHLGSARVDRARELVAVVDRHRKAARRELKSYSRLVQALISGKKPVQREMARALDSESGSCSTADDIIAELRNWPRLNGQNLHAFRLKVKALRYVLQTFPGSDARFLEALGTVKDEIGDWHDWLQLLETARRVLDRPEDREFLTQMDATTRQKFERALGSANGLRKRYMHPASPRKKAS